MSNGSGRRWIPWAWAIVLAAACGGSVVESVDGTGDGGASGKAGSVGASGAPSPGVGGGPGARGGRGGVGGVSGIGASAGRAGSAGSAGYGGGAGYGGSGPICIEQGCGPSGTRCCSENTGCGVAGPGGGYSCTCYRGTWSCTDPGAGDGTCSPGACATSGLVCCRGRCVNLSNDPYNCGSCGSYCGNRYCEFGSCAPIPCYGPLDAGGLCCGEQVCSGAQLCCRTMVGATGGPLYCHSPSASEPSCPVGCPNCF